MLPEMEIGSTFARPWRHVMAMGLEFSEPRLWEPCANYPLRRAAPCALVVLHEAGLRIHGTTKARPAEVFASEERALLLPAPDERWICLITASPRSSRPHISVLGRPYSVPTAFVGNASKCAPTPSSSWSITRGNSSRPPPKPPGGRSTDPDDYPARNSVDATRDLARLVRVAYSHGQNTGTYAERVLNPSMDQDAPGLPAHRPGAPVTETSASKLRAPRLWSSTSSISRARALEGLVALISLTRHPE